MTGARVLVLPRGKTGTGIALAALAGVLWGAMGVAVQFLIQQRGLHTLDLVTLRQLTAGVLLLIGFGIVAPRRAFAVFASPEDLRDIAVSGLLIFLAHYTFFLAIEYSNAGTGAIFLTLEPLFCALWLAFSERRPVTAREALCFALAAAGVALLVTDGDFSALQFSPLSILWGTACAVLSAVYCIQPRRIVARHGVVPVLSWGFLLGGMVASVFNPPWRIDLDWQMPELLAFGFIVLFGTIFAFWSYLSGLRYLSPVMLGLLNCIEPLCAFLFSMLLLGETLGAWEAAGIALVLSNVILLALPKRKTKSAATPDRA